MNGLMEFPEIMILKDKLSELRDELSRLVVKRDQIKYIECENIKANYELVVGVKELKQYELYCSYLRLKRKRDLIQAKLNRKEQFSLLEIESMLDDELYLYEKKLREKLDEVKAAEALTKLPKLSSVEAEELKVLYRMLVKELHPDLHPNQSKDRLKTFHTVVCAYQDGDLASIRVIAEIVRQNKSMDDYKSYNSLDEMKEHLYKDINRFEQLISTVQSEIEQIKNSYPYSLRQILDDEKMLEEKLNKLEEVIKSYEEGVITMENTIEEIIKEAKKNCLI
ncbi:MAG: molecular chaperone DnaJ [Firmicutes bacterium]|nr:molecular chaperone DnaJ [Bacillota bacterium]